jgi:SAM-dependent methyltransferase
MKTTIKKIINPFLPYEARLRIKKSIGQLGRKITNLGIKYYCPMCSSHIKKLLPFGYHFPVLSEKNVIGGGYRSNSRCKVCYSVDRERLLYLYLKNKTSLFSEKTKLLHVAPERALSSIIKQLPHIEYLTADLSSNEVMVKMDITKIQYDDNCFDAVICNHVLEHIIDDTKAMRELYRVLKPNGWAILQVPISRTLAKTYEDTSIVTPEEREHKFGQFDHVRIYASDYVDRLRESGFKVEEFNWWLDDKHFCGSTNRFGLLPEEAIFIARKSLAE